MQSLPIEPGNAPGRWRLYVAAVVIGTAVTAAVTAPDILRKRAAAIADAKAWAVEGQPCPELPLAEVVLQPTATKAFGYADAAFAYAYGHVACAEIHADGGRSLFRGYPTCQFTSPGVVLVDAGGRTAFFVPGLGRRATVTVREGAARCVMASRFYGQQGF